MASSNLLKPILLARKIDNKGIYRNTSMQQQADSMQVAGRHDAERQAYLYQQIIQYIDEFKATQQNPLAFKERTAFLNNIVVISPSSKFISKIQSYALKQGIEDSKVIVIDPTRDATQSINILEEVNQKKAMHDVRTVTNVAFSIRNLQRLLQIANVPAYKINSKHENSLLCQLYAAAKKDDKIPTPSFMIHRLDYLTTSIENLQDSLFYDEIIKLFNSDDEAEKNLNKLLKNFKLLRNNKYLARILFNDSRLALKSIPQKETDGRIILLNTAKTELGSKIAQQLELAYLVKVRNWCIERSQLKKVVHVLTPVFVDNAYQEDSRKELIDELAHQIKYQDIFYRTCLILATQYQANHYQVIRNQITNLSLDKIAPIHVVVDGVRSSLSYDEISNGQEFKISPNWNQIKFDQTEKQKLASHAKPKLQAKAKKGSKKISGTEAKIDQFLAETFDHKTLLRYFNQEITQARAKNKKKIKISLAGLDFDSIDQLNNKADHLTKDKFLYPFTTANIDDNRKNTINNNIKNNINHIINNNTGLKRYLPQASQKSSDSLLLMMLYLARINENHFYKKTAYLSNHRVINYPYPRYQMKQKLINYYCQKLVQLMNKLGYSYKIKKGWFSHQPILICKFK